MTAERAPSRHVVLDGAANVRDIGGYRSSHGLVVTRGRLFRGDSLSQLTDPDVEHLDHLGLRTVVDFRTPGEVLLSGTDRLPYGIEFASLPVGGGDLGEIYELIACGDYERQQRELGDGRAAELMVDINRGFVADPRQRGAFGAALRLLCSPGRLPLLYHCTSGKDRTGWMTAIVLTALGVPRELVLRDYLVSNDLHRTGYAKLRLDLVRPGSCGTPSCFGRSSSRARPTSARRSRRSTGGTGPSTGSSPTGWRSTRRCSANCGVRSSASGCPRSLFLSRLAAARAQAVQP